MRQLRHLCRGPGARIDYKVLSFKESGLGKLGKRHATNIVDRIGRWSQDAETVDLAALLRPLEPELCPMATGFRDFYSETNPAVTAALSPRLLEHREFIYREYLELPVVF